MKQKRDGYARLSRLLGRTRPEEEAREELEHHFASRIEEYVAAGMTPERAKEEALRRLGDMDRYVKQTRDIDERTASERRRREHFDGVRREGKQAMRALARSPVFTLVAVATLGLGLGATGAIYTLLDSVVLRPLPYPVSERLVWVSSWVTGGGYEGAWGVSPAGYFHYRANQRTLDDIGVYSPTSMTISGGAEAVRVEGVYVSGGVLPVLGATPAEGRLLTEADDAPGAMPVMMLSHAFWQRRYGGDRGIVGRTVNVNAVPVEVVGVLSPGVQLPVASADAWMTLRLDPAGPFYNSHYLNAVGRLRAGETVETARRELERLTSRFPETYPGVYSEDFMREFGFRVELHALRDEVLGGISRTLWILLASVGLVLVIACVNVANLFIVRSEIRRRESSVRTALGADRRHLAWHYMVESLLVAVAAAGVAIALVYASTGVITRLAPEGIPRLDEVVVRGATVVVILGLAVLAGIVLALIPLLRPSGDASSVLREGGRGMSASKKQHRLRALLVAAQFALAMMLLAGAGLMLRSFDRLRSVDPGFDAEGVVTMSIALPSVRYPDVSAVGMFFRELVSRVEELPGVASAGLVSDVPLGGSVCALVFVEDRQAQQSGPAPCLPYAIASPGYFAAMGIAVDGDSPTWQDEAARTGAVVVSRAFAERYWHGQNAVGRGLKPNNPGVPYYRVAGVSADVRTRGLDQPAAEIVYYPMAPMQGAQLWGPRRFMSLAVRARSGSPLGVLPAIRGVIADMDPDVPLANIETMETAVERSMARRALAMMLLAIAATMALILSAVGIYGVVSYVVGQRRSEIGVRMALGAQAATVGRMVVMQSLRMAAAGVAVGLALTLVSTRTLGALLFEVSPSDPATLVIVMMVLIAIAVLASWIPAWRASRVNPIEVMRNN